VVYSLVNVPTLIRDLARLPAGPALVADLLQAFALTRPDLEVLNARVVVRAPVGQSRALALAGSLHSGPGRSGTGRPGAGRSGFDVTIGDLDDLVRFVRRDVLSAAWSEAGDLAVATYPAALDVVADGVTATYAGRADIGRTWRHWCATHPYSPSAVAYPLIVDLVRRLDAPARIAPVPAEWAALMHEACWAVYLSGRERTAAITQLAALQALFDLTKPSAPSHSLVATVVAAVHASVGSDLLDESGYDAMTRPFFSLLA
jgi:hypothetical protein